MRQVIFRIIVAALLLNGFSVYSQTVNVTGVVKSVSDQATLPGINILVKNSLVGAATNEKGAYEIKVAPGSVLVFSGIGFLTQEVAVNNRSVINISLEEDTRQLSELVVVGYGTQKKSDLTGSVSSISEAQFKKTPVVSLDNGLKGRAAGVQITSTSNQPGGATSICIRGSNSVNTGSEPLYVIDGFPVYNDNSIASSGATVGPKLNALSLINPNDIVSIEILKDASAAAIYGARGANGVVLVTTKKGQEGRIKIDFNAYYGVQKVSKTLPLLNATEYAQLVNDANGKEIYTPAQIASFGVGTDWQKEIFRSAPIQNYQVSASGGDAKTKYAFSLNYFDQDGIIINSDFKRYSARFNFEKQASSRLTFGSNGYATGIIGKWHQGASKQFQPLNRGFDYHYGFYEGFSWFDDTTKTVNSRNKGIMDSHIWEQGNTGLAVKRRNNEIIQVDDFYTYALAKEANQFIEKNKEKPFFLYVPFNAPHTPFQALKPDVDKYTAKGVKDLNKAIYYSLITGLDSAVGQIHEKVKSLGLEDNTLIIFLSDNGGATYTHATDNAPLRGGKMTLYEGGVNVPFALKWKGKVQAGTVVDAPISSLDIFATAAAITGSKLPGDRIYDGVNLVSFLTGKEKSEPHNILYWRSGYNKAIRKGDWKLVLNLKDNITALYNLKTDKSEKNDLSASNTAKVQELQKNLAEWEKQLVKPLWPGNGFYQDDVNGKPDRFSL